jgi:hypothetical protein
MLTTLLIANVIISVLHSIKHIPQCMHMIENETSESLSMRYIQGELFLNMLSTMTTFKLFITIHNSMYLLPILIEKSFAFCMIVVMFHLKLKYSNEDSDDESEYNDTWKDVESDDDDWHSVESGCS